HFVGAGAQHGVHVLDAADTATHDERHEEPLGGPAHDVEQRGAPLLRRRDVEEDDLVRSLRLVARGERHRVADVAAVDEAHPLDDAPVAHVETDDDALLEHQRSSCQVTSTAPLVLNTPSPGASAWRKASPSAFTAASTTWWRSVPRRTTTWRLIAAFS